MTTGNCRDVAEEIKGRIEELRQERDEACVERDKLKARVNELEGRAPECKACIDHCRKEECSWAYACKVVLALKARAKDLKDWEGQWEAAADRVNKQSAELTALRANHEQAARRVADVLWRARPHGITDREKWVATAAKTILSELRAESAEVIATVTLKGAPPREATVEIEKPASACPDCAVPMTKTSDPLGENVRWVCEGCGESKELGFVVCAACASKPDKALLCNPCMVNRRTIEKLIIRCDDFAMWLDEIREAGELQRYSYSSLPEGVRELRAWLDHRCTECHCPDYRCQPKEGSLKSLEANVAGHERAIGVLIRMVFRAAYTTQGFSRLTEEDARLLEKWKP